MDIIFKVHPHLLALYYNYFFVPLLCKFSDFVWWTVSMHLCTCYSWWFFLRKQLSLVLQVPETGLPFLMHASVFFFSFNIFLYIQLYLENLSESSWKSQLQVFFLLIWIIILVSFLMLWLNSMNKSTYRRKISFGLANPGIRLRKQGMKAGALMAYTMNHSTIQKELIRKYRSLFFFSKSAFGDTISLIIYLYIYLYLSILILIFIFIVPSLGNNLIWR